MDFEKYHINEADITATRRAYTREDGSLKGYPHKQKKQVILLCDISQRLTDGITYSEKELNALLQTFYPDYAILRRGLIDFGLMERTTDGSSYWKTQPNRPSSQGVSMWTCPKCARTFAHKEQQHFCRTPGSIDQYINDQPPSSQAALHEVRRVIAEVVPMATECIKWQMPTFYQTENIIHFAYNKNHLGIYPGEEAVAHFSTELKERGMVFSKGAIRLPWAELDLELIRRITEYRKQILSL